MNGKVVKLKGKFNRELNSAEKSQIAAENIVKLFINSLDPSVTKQELTEYFSKFGTVAEGVVMLGENGKSKGFGFVTFTSSLAVQKCLESRPHFLGGQGVDVKISTSKISTSQYRRDPELTEDNRIPNTKKDVEVKISKDIEGKWLSVDRLPNPVKGGRVWRHDQEGEKHRIKFCATENITLLGIGLRVKAPISRLTLNICQESGHCKGQYNGTYSDHATLFMENFYNLSPSSSDGTTVVKLRHGVQLSCERIYLLVLTLHGGASYVGTGGEEFVTVGEEREVLFKFEDYKHKTDKPGQTTNVERGLLEKIYFNL